MDSDDPPNKRTADSDEPTALPPQKRHEKGRRVGYVHGGELQARQDAIDDQQANDKDDDQNARLMTAHLAASDRLPANRGRASLVHDLIAAYGLVDKLVLIPPRKATKDEMAEFHDEAYLDLIESTDATLRREEKLPRALIDELDEYGLVDDCAPFKGLYDHVQWIAGGSIAAADALRNSEADVVIHWPGGRHHAHREAASGFCFVNDIVLAILRLQETYDRIMYIDVDLHHGDGVEEAFAFTSSVATVSFHKHAHGFFPGSGASNDIGKGQGRNFSLNIPLRDGLRSRSLTQLVHNVLPPLKERFKPEAVVLQCGCDGLQGDPWKAFNLTIDAFVETLRLVLTWDVPLLLLGGGGYNSPNVARCWTTLTAECLSIDLPVDIPTHDRLQEYNPDYQRLVVQGSQADMNTPELIAALTASALSVVSRINSVPE